MKLIGLLSGGIDSAVALYLLKRQGAEITPVYFDLGQFSGEDTKKRTLQIAKKLGFKELIVIPHGEALAEFKEKADPRYTCVFCKRTMLRVASMLAKELGAEALITGEALGQVASQTPENLRAESPASSVPVLRPLIGLNKGEIIEIAREIGTFEASTRRVACCQAVPSKPATRSSREQIEAAEAKIGIETLASAALSKAQRNVVK